VLKKIPKWIWPFAWIVALVLTLRVCGVQSEQLTGMSFWGFMIAVYLPLWCGLWMLADWNKARNETIKGKTITRIIKIFVVVQVVAFVAIGTHTLLTFLKIL